MFKELFLGLASLGATEVDIVLTNADVNSASSPIEMNIRVLSDEERIEMYMDEFEKEVVPLFIANIEKIRKLKPNGRLTDLNTLRMNFATYRFAQDEFGVGWITPWYFHDEESTSSFNDEAYVEGPDGQFGPMQRARDFNPDSQVAVLRLRYPILDKLPQKRPGDAAEIVWAPWKLDRDAQATMKREPHKDRAWALQDATIGYSRGDIGENRWKNIQILNGIFVNS